MQIGVWSDGIFRSFPLDGLKTGFDGPTWFDITDPQVVDLERIADTLDVPRNVLLGRLRSNHSHVDALPNYTKIFAWHLDWLGDEKGHSFERTPAIVLINRSGVITISKSQSNLGERISKDMGDKSLASLSIHARVTYIFMKYLLESYERLTEHFEVTTERLEEAIPPWPRQFYSSTFAIKKEASKLLRLTKHLSPMVEALSRGNLYTKFTDEERMVFDGLYERAVGAEETMEVALDTMRDLINLHLDMVSYGMNRGMRLLAAITVIVGVSTVVAALFGMNLVDIPQLPLNFWEVVLLDLIASVVMIAIFYSKGWLVEK